jgi:hypothetical protein
LIEGDEPENGELLDFVRITNSGTAGIKTGLKQTLERTVEHPQRPVISYKIRASKEMKNLGYTNQEETDGADTVNAGTEWQYRLHLVTVDYPPQYSRSFEAEEERSSLFFRMNILSKIYSSIQKNGSGIPFRFSSKNRTTRSCILN